MLLRAGAVWQRDALHWLESLALLAFGPRLCENPRVSESPGRRLSRRRTTEAENVLAYLVAIREWSTGALLHAIKTAPPQIKMQLRSILAQHCGNNSGPTTTGTSTSPKS